jgi:hypothetical protein
MTWVNEVTGLPSGGGSTNWTDIAATTEKYYRVYAEFTGGDVKADDTVGQMTVLVKVNRNQVSSMFEPYPVGGGTPGASTLDKIIGNQLTGNTVKTLSDRIEIWSNALGAYKSAYYRPGTGWQDYNVGGAPAFGLDADKGYWFIILPIHTQKNVMFCGRVSKTNRSVPIGLSRNLVGSCFPVSCTLAKTGLVASGFKGSTVSTLSDSVEFWNNVPGAYQRFWFRTSDSTWQPSASLRSIAAGDAIWVTVVPIAGHAAFTWNYPVPPRP